MISGHPSRSRPRGSGGRGTLESGGPLVAAAQGRAAGLAQRGQHLASAREPPVRVLREGLLDDLGQDLGRPRRSLAHGDGILLHDLVEDPVHRLGVEGLAADQELVEQATQREDVGASVRPLPADLLGGHVMGGPHDHPGGRHLRAAQAGQPEVHDLHLAAREDVDVGRLEVAVDDVVGVSERQPLADLQHHADLLVEGHRARGESVLQVDPVEQLHGHERLPCLEPELVHRDDVRVVEEGGGLRLPLEPLAHHLVGVEAGRDALDRDGAVQDRVVGAEHLAHGALAELADDLVLSDARGEQLARILPRPPGLTRR